MTARVHFASASAAGTRAMEDRFAVLDLGQTLLLVVADGAGGRGGGAQAAEQAVDEIMRRAKANEDRVMDLGFWADVLCDIDRNLMGSRTGGETTLALAVDSPEGIGGVSIGDSAAWLVTERGYENLTENQETRLRLGCAGSGPTPFFSRSQGTLMVMSDGLWRYSAPRVLCEIARQDPLGAAAGRLVDAVRLRSGAVQDDVTVLLCRRVGRASGG